MRIAVVVGGFPVVSETFITNHVVGLIESGNDVRVFMRRPNWKSPAVTSLRGVDLLRIRRNAVLPGTGGSPRRLLSFALFTLRALFTAPGRSLGVAYRSVKERGGTLPGNPLATWARVLPFLQPWRPEVLHCHFGTNGLLGADVVRSGAVSAPLIVSFHGRDAHVVPRKKGDQVYSAMFEQARFVTANTRFTADKVMSLGCPEAKVRVVPMGFFLEPYRFHSAADRHAGEPFRLLTVARLVAKKGIEDALRAVRMLAQRGLELDYAVVGDGELRPTLEARVREWGLTDRVTFYGWQDTESVARLMASSHAFILPSVTTETGDMEGQALVLQEAQAVGLPVVSTWHNGIPDGVDIDRSGFLVPEHSPDALADALETLVTQPKRRNEMVRAAREFIQQNYHQVRLTSSWEELYREATL